QTSDNPRREARPNRVPTAGRRHPAICCGRDVRRPPNTSKAIILTGAEPREWFHLPDSARHAVQEVQEVQGFSRNLSTGQKFPASPRNFGTLRPRVDFERPSTEFQRSSERAEH